MEVPMRHLRCRRCGSHDVVKVTYSNQGLVADYVVCTCGQNGVFSSFYSASSEYYTHSFVNEAVERLRREANNS